MDKETQRYIILRAFYDLRDKGFATDIIVAKQSGLQRSQVSNIMNFWKDKKYLEPIEGMQNHMRITAQGIEFIENYDVSNKDKILEGKENSNMEPCGPLAKSICDQGGKIKEQFSEKNIFLDIPYSNYDDCEDALRELLKDLSLNPVVSKDKFTSNTVLCKVCALIKTCKYGITDISSASNSVSYEYGLMHGLGMKVCLALRVVSEGGKFTFT